MPPTATETSSPVALPSENHHPLLYLPRELLQQLIASYCTGKSISTLLSATRACPHHGEMIEGIIRRVLQSRVDKIIHRTASLSSASRIHRFVHSVMREQQDNHRGGVVHYLSTRLAVMDYFESNKNKNTKLHMPEAFIEFPIWTGVMHVAHHSNQGNGWASQMSVQVQLSTPFWNPHLIGSFRSSMQMEGMKVIPRSRNFRTVPPLGRMEGVRTMDVETIASMIRPRMAEHDEVLAPQITVGSGVSFFLLTYEQARRHCPSYLPNRLDPYHFMETAAMSSAGLGDDGDNDKPTDEHNSELYCLWMQPNDEDDETDDALSLHSMEEIIDLMKRINVVQQSTMLPEMYT